MNSRDGDIKKPISQNPIMWPASTRGLRRAQGSICLTSRLLNLHSTINIGRTTCFRYLRTRKSGTEPINQFARDRIAGFSSANSGLRLPLENAPSQGGMPSSWRLVAQEKDSWPITELKTLIFSVQAEPRGEQESGPPATVAHAKS